jgi:hypothetical protein
MIGGVRRGLCAASMFLLCMAAPLLLSVSTVAAKPVPGVAAANVQPHQAAFQLHASSRACSHLTPPVTCKAALFHLVSRAFAEDAPPPPSETLLSAELRLPLTPAAVARAGSPPLRTGLFSVCNRQRAP